MEFRRVLFRSARLRAIVASNRRGPGSSTSMRRLRGACDGGENGGAHRGSPKRSSQGATIRSDCGRSWQAIDVAQVLRLRCGGFGERATAEKTAALTAGLQKGHRKARL